MNYTWHANYQSTSRNSWRLQDFVVKITTAFIPGLGKSIWFVQMLRLLNRITFLCAYLGGKVGGEKHWGQGHGFPGTAATGESWPRSDCPPASPRPPTVAGGRGLSCLPLEAPTSDPEKKERWQRKPASAQHLLAPSINPGEMRDQPQGSRVFLTLD